MDTKFKEILDGLPNRRPRSRRAPYRDLIRELRRRGRTYRDIADILGEKCQVQVTASGFMISCEGDCRPKVSPA